MRKYSGLSAQAQYNHKGPSKREAERQESEKGNVMLEAERKIRRHLKKEDAVRGQEIQVLNTIKGKKTNFPLKLLEEMQHC